MQVAFAGDRRALAPNVVRRVVDEVLRGEGIDHAAVSVTFISGPRMRGLNRRSFGRDKATDVIAFGLPHDDRLVGDIYVCPAVARRSARRFNIPARQELIRLVIHGTLHVLGYDHPEDAQREPSRMWLLQERYVEQLSGSSA